MSQGYTAFIDQDVSESEGPSEEQVLQQVAADVTEIYRCKPRSYETPAFCQHQTYYQPEKVYGTTCLCNARPEPRPRYYKDPGVQRRELIAAPLIPSDLRNLQKAAPVKKYPVTYPVTRYNRCPAPTLCKRPSTRCLPVTCHPDPVTYRPRKPAPELHYRGQEVPYDYGGKTEVKPVDSQGDVNARVEDLEAIFRKMTDKEDAIEIKGVNEISKILKPRVPASVKAKQSKVGRLNATKSSGEYLGPGDEISKLDVKAGSKEPLNVTHKRFNEANSNQAIDRKTQKAPLDDNSALELHKSKTYIISLIDKALSKELGTVPEKAPENEFTTMSPKRAVSLVKRHLPKNLELDQQTSTILLRKSEESGRQEEPTYLKQLKQLRWNHLRHIQREAKRLADLERFLDGFNDDTST